MRFIQRGWLIWLPVSLLMLSACGQLEFGVETKVSTGRPAVTTVATVVVPDNMALVTVTPPLTETPIPTPTAVASDTPSPSATVVTETPTSVPTRVPTIRPPQPSSTPSPLPPEIFSLTAVPDAIIPGDTLTASWRAQGERATLCLTTVEGYWLDCYDVSLTGSQLLAANTDYRGDMGLELRVFSGPEEAVRSVPITVSCPDDWWFFENPPDNCPGWDAVESFAAAQQFEGGWMLWIESSDTIYVFFNEPRQTYSVFYDLLEPEDSEPPADDYQPPDDKFVPIRGFGLVWRENVWVREQLGWALAPEFGFDTTYQWESAPNYHFFYVLDPDGNIIIMDTIQQTWGVWRG